MHGTSTVLSLTEFAYILITGCQVIGWLKNIGL